MSDISSNEYSGRSVEAIKEFFGALDVYGTDVSSCTIDFSRQMASYFVPAFTRDKFVEAYLEAWGVVSDAQHLVVIWEEMTQMICLVFDDAAQEILSKLSTALGKQKLLITAHRMLDNPPPFSLRG